MDRGLVRRKASTCTEPTQDMRKRGHAPSKIWTPVPSVHIEYIVLDRTFNLRNYWKDFGEMGIRSLR